MGEARRSPLPQRGWRSCSSSTRTSSARRQCLSSRWSGAPSCTSPSASSSCTRSSPRSSRSAATSPWSTLCPGPSARQASVWGGLPMMRTSGCSGQCPLRWAPDVLHPCVHLCRQRAGASASLSSRSSGSRPATILERAGHPQSARVPRRAVHRSEAAGIAPQANQCVCTRRRNGSPSTASAGPRQQSSWCSGTARRRRTSSTAWRRRSRRPAVCRQWTAALRTAAAQPRPHSAPRGNMCAARRSELQGDPSTWNRMLYTLKFIRDAVRSTRAGQHALAERSITPPPAALFIHTRRLLHAPVVRRRWRCGARAWCWPWLSPWAPASCPRTGSTTCATTSRWTPGEPAAWAACLSPGSGAAGAC